MDESGTEWKLICSSGSGGWTESGWVNVDPRQPIADYSALQLYNMTIDPGELNNLLDGGGTDQVQDKADQLQTLLAGYIASGRSAPHAVPGPSTPISCFCSDFEDLVPGA